MKNLVILGASRAGKSTLAREINKIYSNYHIINGDAVRDAFAESLPQNEINANDGKGMEQDFPKFLERLLNNQAWHNRDDFNYILETCDVSVENAVKLFKNENNVIIFLGYAEISVNEAFSNYRKYDTSKEWSFKETDESLLNHAQEWINKSKVFKQKCEKYNVRYIDTSYNREEVLKELINELEEELKK